MTFSHCYARIICLLALARFGETRTWRDVPAAFSVMNLPDLVGQRYLHDHGTPHGSSPTASPTSNSPTRMPASPAPSLWSTGPTTNPTSSPTVISTPPSLSPSLNPTTTLVPSSYPSRVPTQSVMPTHSSQPSMTADPYPSIPPPDQPEPWYFNYNTSVGSLYGPGELGLIPVHGSLQVGIRNNRWGSVANTPDSYWVEFTDEGFGPWKGILSTRNPLKNVCDIGKWQSPIDVVESGAICYELHQVRSHPGDVPLDGETVTRLIDRNKLRIIYPRRTCWNYTNDTCAEPVVPNLDFPNGWRGSADILHVDFKVPGEHFIRSQRFDGEMQIYSLHPNNRRLGVHVAMITATPDGFNYVFEEMLAAFRLDFIYNQAACAATVRRRRKLVSDLHQVLASNVSSMFHDYETWADFSTGLDEPDFQRRSEEVNRHLTIDWNPSDPLLVPSFYFYRYDGSLTEPPCGEFVSWFIADSPMTISLDQLEILKRYIFLNVDTNCTRTSVQFNHSVARPIRPSNDRPVWHCTADNFPPDSERAPTPTR